MTEDEFLRLAAEGHNRIPLVRELLADLDTPLSLYLKLCGGQPHGFLLESVIGGERFGRYSFIGLPARSWLRATGEVCERLRDGEVVERHEGNPLEWVAAWQERLKPAVLPGLPRFCGGLAGYFGYETVRAIEPRLRASRQAEGLGTPDLMLLLSEEVAVIDNLSGRLYLIVWADPADVGAHAAAVARLDQLGERLRQGVPSPAPQPCAPQPVIREREQADYEAAVLRAKDYIAAGDCMQVVIGQRLKKRFEGDPLNLYRALRSLNPSPYMYFYDMGEFQIVGASPEILVREEHRSIEDGGGRTVTVRPLAGTRPRGATPQADALLEAELRADAKERAEHLMLIDLARNDIGRIARTGSVKVTQAFDVERYSHVMHIVSNVEGVLRPDAGQLDVLKATFPAGTLTGAPKVRAMELIDELEPVQRGLYGGACGYLSFAGDMDLAIAIRTGVIKDGWLYVQAAAGVVADSVPELEWRETEAKARAVLAAAEQVERGL
jgi:anthranilate synthase component 1